MPTRNGRAWPTSRITGASRVRTVAAPTASVIIVTLDGRRHLERTLPAVFEQDLDGGFEVILVDNGSADGTAEWVREQHPAVRLVEAGRNLGFAAGNNRAFDAAEGEFLVLLNNDARPRPGWLSALVAAAREPRVGAVTSRLLFADRPDVLQSAGAMLLTDGGGADRGMGEPDDGRYGGREEVFAFNGAAALLTRDALRDTGVFDESYFMYYEDLDLSWRMRLRGWRILYEPSAVVDHEHAGTSREGSPFFHFHADRNRLFTVFKNAPPRFVAHAFSSALRRTRRPGPASPRPGGSHRKVAVSFALHVPGLVWKRAAIRARRRVPDREVLRWAYPREKWDARST